MSLIIETLEDFFNGKTDLDTFKSELESTSKCYENDGDYKYFLERLKDHTLVINKNITKELFNKRYEDFKEESKKYLKRI